MAPASSTPQPPPSVWTFPLLLLNFGGGFIISWIILLFPIWCFTQMNRHAKRCKNEPDVPEGWGFQGKEKDNALGWFFTIGSLHLLISLLAYYLKLFGQLSLFMSLLTSLLGILTLGILVFSLVMLIGCFIIGKVEKEKGNGYEPVAGEEVELEEGGVKEDEDGQTVVGEDASGETEEGKA